MIFLAIRYLMERKRQSILTLLGVFFGTMAFVSVSGFFLGFQGFLVQQLVNGAPQVHIEARQDYLYSHTLDQAFFGDEKSAAAIWSSPPAGVKGYLEVQNPQAWYKRLDADDRILAYSPTLTAAALFTNGNVSVAANMIGCHPDQHAKVSTVADYMVMGSFSNNSVGGYRLLMGDEIMKRLGLGINQTVLVSVGTYPPVPFKVVGRFYTGSRGVDLQTYANLDDVQRVNHTPNQINEIGVRLKDFTEADNFARSWSKMAPERVESWADQNLNILSIFAIQNALKLSMVLTVLIVAGFGIYNILNMTVNQKRQDIAILRALGYDSFDVVMLFFSQGIIVGIVGAFFGLVAGYLFCLWLQTLSFMVATPNNPQGHLHIAINLSIYVQGLALALMSASIASILPARAAGKMTPIDIIRQGG